MSSMQHMGQSKYSKIFRGIDNSLLGIYKLFPTTYVGILKRIINPLLKDPQRTFEVLDLACGDGTATQLLGLPSNFKITGVDLHDPYIQLAKKSGIYNQVIKHDVRTFLKTKKYDVIIASHVIEHLEKNEAMDLIKKISAHATKLALIATPIGELPQEEYDNNSLQIHRSQFSVQDFYSLGFKVKSQGVKFLWKNENVGLKYGLFSYAFFLVSFILSPLLILRPEWGTYMICYRYNA